MDKHLRSSNIGSFCCSYIRSMCSTGDVLDTLYISKCL